MRAIAWIRVDGTIHKGCPGVDEPSGWAPLYEIEVGDKVHRRGVAEKGSEYAKHEVLDRVNLFAQMIGRFLLEDELVKERKDLHGSIQVAHDTLMEVYQALGVEHPLPKHFDEEEGEQGLPIPVGEVKEYFDQQMDTVDQLISQLPMLAVPVATMPVVQSPPKYVFQKEGVEVRCNRILKHAGPVVGTCGQCGKGPCPLPSEEVQESVALMRTLMSQQKLETVEQKQAEKAQCWDDLMEACGHWQDGSDKIVKLIQDETVRECGIYVKTPGKDEGPAFWGKTFEQALKAWKDAT